MDPLAEKYYGISPYAYCSNNPINKIDLDGRDEWEINEKGELVRQIENKEKTGFYIVNSDGNRIDGRSVEFNYTDITHSSGIVNGDNYDAFTISGDEYATKTFEFMAQQFGVLKEYGGIPDMRLNAQEWALARFGKEGSNEVNVVTSVHQHNYESTHGKIIDEYLNNGYNLRESIHNHPYGSYADAILRPSGINGDRGFAKELIEKNSILPVFKIYSGYLKRYIEYNGDGIIKK